MVGKIAYTNVFCLKTFLPQKDNERYIIYLFICTGDDMEKYAHYICKSNWKKDKPRSDRAPTHQGDKTVLCLCVLQTNDRCIQLLKRVYKTATVFKR